MATAGARPWGASATSMSKYSYTNTEQPTPAIADGPLAQMVVVDGLGHQAVDRAVMAAGAEMEGNIPQRGGTFKDLLHG